MREGEVTQAGPPHRGQSEAERGGRDPAVGSAPRPPTPSPCSARRGRRALSRGCGARLCSRTTGRRKARASPGPARLAILSLREARALARGADRGLRCPAAGLGRHERRTRSRAPAPRPARPAPEPGAATPPAARAGRCARDGDGDGGDREAALLPGAVLLRDAAAAEAAAAGPAPARPTTSPALPPAGNQWPGRGLVTSPARRAWAPRDRSPFCLRPRPARVLSLCPPGAAADLWAAPSGAPWAAGPRGRGAALSLVAVVKRLGLV